MNQFWQKFRNFRAHFLLSAALGLLLFYLSFRLPDGWSDLFVNLAATFFALTITFFGLDVMIEIREGEQWRLAKHMAEKDLERLVNVMIAYFRGPMGIDFPEGVRKNDATAWDAQRKILDDIRVDTLTTLRAMKVQDWKNLQINILFVRKEISSYLQVFSPHTEPRKLGQLLAVRQKFNEFDNWFGTFHDLFTKPESEWPANRKGPDENRKLREGLLPSLAVSLEGYFEAVANLFGEVVPQKGGAA